jgi:hypothetical protein
MIRKLMLVGAALSVAGLALGPAAVPAGAVATAKVGTVEGSVTTQGGAPLNGVCVHLFDPRYTVEKVAFAGSGTTGVAGFFTQANVPVGHYKAVFANCGANTNGNPDFNYETIFYGNTFNPSLATKLVVTANTATSLGTNQIPLGGTVTGTVTDATVGGPAFPMAIAAAIPGIPRYNVTGPAGWLIVCAGQDGSYSVSGVPTTGAKMVFSPSNWACPDQNGNFNFNQWVQTTRHALVMPPSDGTLSGINAAVPEHP